MRFIISILLLLPLLSNATIRDTVPNAVPQWFGAKLYEFRHYTLTDSFIMNRPGPITDVPYWPALKFNNANNRWSAWDLSSWKSLLIPGDTVSLSTRINNAANISNTSLTANDNYAQNWNNKQLYFDSVGSNLFFRAGGVGNTGTRRKEFKISWGGSSFGDLLDGFSIISTIRNAASTSDSIYTGIISGGTGVTSVGVYNSVLGNNFISYTPSGLINISAKDSIWIKGAEVAATADTILALEVRSPTVGKLKKIPITAAGALLNNIGSGFRWAASQFGNIKTAFGSNTILLDSSSNSNALTFKADTSVLATQSDISAFGNVSGSGTANQIAYWSGSNTLTGNNNFVVNGSLGRVTLGSTGAGSTAIWLAQNSASVGTLGTWQDWRFCANEYLNTQPSEGVINNYTNFDGYNIDASGARVNTSEPSQIRQIERAYVIAGYGLATEWWRGHTNANGNTVRPEYHIRSWYSRKSLHQWTATNFEWNDDSTANNLLALNSNGVVSLSSANVGSVPYIGINAIADGNFVLKQRNAANSADLALIGALNDSTISPGGSGKFVQGGNFSTFGGTTDGYYLGPSNSKRGGLIADHQVGDIQLYSFNNAWPIRFLVQNSEKLRIDGTGTIVQSSLYLNTLTNGSSADSVLVVSNGLVKKRDAQTITATATLDFGSTAAGTSTDLTITATGAVLGDLVVLGIPNASMPVNGGFVAWVSAADTVTVRYFNNDLVSARDPGSGSFKVRILK